MFIMFGCHACKNHLLLAKWTLELCLLSARAHDLPSAVRPRSESVHCAVPPTDRPVRSATLQRDQGTHVVPSPRRARSAPPAPVLCKTRVRARATQQSAELCTKSIQRTQSVDVPTKTNGNSHGRWSHSKCLSPIALTAE